MQSHGELETQCPGTRASGQLGSQVCVGHSLASKSVFPSLCLIQRAGDRREECVCVRERGMLRCRGRGSL